MNLDIAKDTSFRTLSGSLRKFVHHHSHKRAIYSIGQEFLLNFEQLEAVVETSARRMASMGVGPGNRVAILSGECVEKLVLMFAAWRCGASACPFHTEINSHHLKSILHTIRPALVLWRNDIDGTELTAELSCPNAYFQSLEEEQGFFAIVDPHYRLPPVGTEYGPEDEACIFATSGTTDRPKCVVWDHLGLWMCGLSTIDFTGMCADDRLLEYRTFSWLSPQIVTFMPFVQLGLTIFIADGFSRSRFFDWIKEHRITVAAGVPTVINMLLDDPVPVDAEYTRSMRLMTASSAPLAPERWRQFEERYGIPILQFYGASEGGWLCGNRHDRRKIGTAGPPARYMDLAIVAPDGQICPPNIEGEITIRGPQTATATITSDGQWEDRNAFRLTERVRIGDLGVMDDNGFVTVTGRVKDVIMRGGVSISPLEIDAAMMAHSEVSEAAAVGIPDPVWGEEIACFVVPASGSSPDERTLLDYAHQVLPSSRRPRWIVLVRELTKNERGKVRRDELKKLWGKLSGQQGEPAR